MNLHDAYLVFRALCRLSIKPLPESSDGLSVALKSKLLSLWLLDYIVARYFDVISSTAVIFVNASEDGGSNTNRQAIETTFVDGVKQYLCVGISRNAVSLVPEVIDKSLAIFFKLVIGMRHWLKVIVSNQHRSSSTTERD
jgi:brefeldin A-inhibited guanine nucleotide-exchange protein